MTRLEPLSAVDTSGSVPPPASAVPIAPAAPSIAETPAPGRSEAHGSDRLDRAQAEALAKVAALAATSRDEPGPSKAIFGTALALGVLVVAMLLLAVAVSL